MGSAWIVDAVVVACSLAILVVTGWRHRSHDRDSYWVAGRSGGIGHIAISLVATIFGASSTLGLIGLGYQNGLTGAWWTLIGACALVPFGLFLAGRIRSLNVYTLPDILRQAYGDSASVLAGIMIAVAWCGVIAAQMIAAGRLLSAVLPIDFQVGLAAVATVFVVYTLLGGQHSILRTDLWQFGFFLAAVALAFVFLSIVGFGSNTFVAQVPSAHLRFPVSNSFTWYDLLVFYPLVVGLPYLAGPDMYSRVLCAKDNNSARRATLIAAGVVAPLSLCLALLGVLARGVFPDLVPDAALPEIAMRTVPIGLRGIVIAGFLGAVMSSADTCLMSASVILARNVAAPLGGLPESRQLLLSRIGIPVIGLIAWGIAVGQPGIISSLLLGYTVFAGGVALPVLASFWRRRLGVTRPAALTAILLGGSTAVLGKLTSGEVWGTVLTDRGVAGLRFVLGPHYADILPILLSAVALLLVGRITGSKRRPNS